MITGAEIGLGIKALKTAFDIAKEAKDLTDTTAMRSKIIEMQGLIMDAQAGAIAAREAHAEQIDRIRALEAEVRDFKTRQAEIERYELKDLGWGAFAYMLKPDARGSEPPHWACANCYKKCEIAILQHTVVRNLGTKWECPSCKNLIQPSKSIISWI